MPRKRRATGRRAWGSGHVGVRKSDGRPYAQARLPNGRRLTEYGSIREPPERERRRLEAWLADVARAVERGRDPALGSLTFGEWAADWLETQAARVEPETAYNYRRRLAMFAALDRVRLADLSGPTIQRVLNALAARYAPSTVTQARNVLSQCLKPLVRRGPLDGNPVEETRPPGRAERASRRVHTAEQARRYLAAAEAFGELGELCLLVQETGLRSCEARALQWRDLDGRRVEVRRRLTLDGRGVKERSKTAAGTRTVAISPELAARLERRRGSPTAYLFHRPIGMKRLAPGNPPTADDALKRAHWPICDAAGLERCRLHDLRHGMVTLLRRRGVSVEIAQAVIGHRDLRTTLQTYREIAEEDVDVAAGAVAEYLRPVPKAGEEGAG